MEEVGVMFPTNILNSQDYVKRKGEAQKLEQGHMDNRSISQIQLKVF